MEKHLKTLLSIIGGTIFSNGALAFDDDPTINDTGLRAEAFLDIKAYEFSKVLQQQWNNSVNGWRMTGGSLDRNRLFLQTDFRLKESLSDHLSVGLQLDQETFYAIKPFPRPLLEIEVQPWSAPIEFSLLGTAALDKREADIGGAVTYGHRPWNYFRVVWLSQDYFYNTKNVFDQSYYVKKPQEVRIDTAYYFNERIAGRFYWERSEPMEFVKNDGSDFFHNSNNYKIELNYYLPTHAWYGLTFRGFSVDKALQESAQYQQQMLSFNSLDLYWVTLAVPDWQITFGTEGDEFGNRLRNKTDENESFYYKLKTWQLYSVLHHDYSVHKAWELGLFVGYSNETTDYLLSYNKDLALRKVEAKLRTSWEYHSYDKKKTLIFHFTFNLDDLIRDPGDGGGMTFQSTF